MPPIYAPAFNLLAIISISFLGVTIGDVATCSHTFPDGNTFDLSGLVKPGGERDWYADDRNGNMYYFNICADANDVPESCQYLEKAVQAPVYQVSNESDCFWLGQLRSMEWELIDENEPAAGVELYYFDGEQCAGGVARDVRVQFFCDPDAGAGKPLDYYVLEEDCHYSITWPSKYGCPADGGAFVGGLTGWGFVGYFFLAVAAYVGGGCAYNVLRLGASPGPEALPHPEFWREVPGLVADGVQFARGKVEELLGRKKTSGYEKVDGVEYEWGT